jgi:acyl-CoA thioester hydrolase
MKESKIFTLTEIPVRFNEVDSMQIVWHGHYVKYMEEGREAFGKEHGISYMDWKAMGYMVPLVNIALDYRKALQYGDIAIVETRLVDTEAAKVIYSFKIFRKSDNELMATGESTQVFLDMNRELILTVPNVFEDWKVKHGLRNNS